MTGRACAVLATLGALLLVGCAEDPATTRPVSPVDGVRGTVYAFEAGDEVATRRDVRDRAQVARIVDYLARSRGRAGQQPERGAHYEAYVIDLHDGSTLEALHAWRSPKENWVWTEEQGWVDVHLGGDLEIASEGPGATVPIGDVPMAEQRVP